MTAIVDSPEAHELLDDLTRMTGREDPYPHYDRLREMAPLLRAGDGALVTMRYADCATVVRDTRFGHLPTEMLAFAGLPDWAEHPALRQLFTSMLAVDPPDHTRLRRLVSSTFTARRVQALRPAIEATVAGLLDDLADDPEFIHRFAFPLPVTVIGELLGVPAADRAQFQTVIRDWSQVLDTITPAVLAKADPAAATLRDYLAGLAAERRAAPRDDLISALVAAGSDGDRLTEDELLTTAGLLFAAGFETTTNLLANGLAALRAHGVRELGDPAAAVEELLRYDSPVQIVSRVVHEDAELGGVTVEAGERVVAYVGAGNRDPRRFPQPHRLDPSRADNAPLSFGGGIHYCLGAPLARLEAQIAFPALLKRFGHLEITSATRRDSLTLRGFTRMSLQT